MRPGGDCVRACSVRTCRAIAFYHILQVMLSSLFPSPPSSPLSLPCVNETGARTRLLTPEPSLAAPRFLRHARVSFSRTPLAATAPSKHVYTSNELTRHTYRATSHGCNFLRSNLPSELARSRGPICCPIRVQSRFAFRSRLRTATSPGLAFSLSFSPPGPVSSDKSK